MKEWKLFEVCAGIHRTPSDCNVIYECMTAKG